MYSNIYLLGHRLMDNVVSEYNSLSVLECSLYCLRKFPECKSINCKGTKRQKICQLNNATKSTHSRNLVADKIYNYYEPLLQV